MNKEILANESTMSVKGAVMIERFDESGSLVEKREIKNLVVTVGKNFIVSRMAGTSSGVMSHMAVGTGTASAVAADTACGTEIGRVALTSTTPATNSVTYVATFPAGTGTGAITEAGLFNAASAGTMLARTVFPVVNKGSADSISITWVVSIN